MSYLCIKEENSINFIKYFGLNDSENITYRILGHAGKIGLRHTYKLLISGKKKWTSYRSPDDNR